MAIRVWIMDNTNVSHSDYAKCSFKPAGIEDKK